MKNEERMKFCKAGVLIYRYSVGIASGKQGKMGL